jgi:hypothetical protein
VQQIAADNGTHSTSCNWNFRPVRAVPELNHLGRSKGGYDNRLYTMNRRRCQCPTPTAECMCGPEDLIAAVRQTRRPAVNPTNDAEATEAQDCRLQRTRQACMVRTAVTGGNVAMRAGPHTTSSTITRRNSDLMLQQADRGILLAHVDHARALCFLQGATLKHATANPRII